MEDEQKPIMWPPDDPNATYYESVSISPLLKLDKVLEYLHDDKPPGKTLAEINDYVKRKYNLELGQSNTILALNKMRKEGYVTMDKRPLKIVNSFTNPEKNKVIQQVYYYITFDGVILYKRGGYTQKEKDEDSQRELFPLLQKRLNFLTLILAIGSGILALIEVLKFLIDYDF